jgi:Gas vesicle protein
MEPQRESQATVGDLLERVLDKGIVLKLDLIIGVAGIPLIGISVQGAIAAIETMLQYGMMEAWDAQTRAYAIREAQRQQSDLQPGEHAVLELYGSYQHARGISRVWRPGRLILTDRRVLLVRPAPREVLFETRLSAIAGIGRVAHEDAHGGRREIVCLALADGALAAIYTARPETLEASLRERLQRLGQAVVEISGTHLERLDPAAVAEGHLWHRLAPGSGQAPWRSGWAVLTGNELTWWADMEQRALLRVPVSAIWGLAVERRDLGVLGDRDVLVVTYGSDGHRAEALFAGEGIDAWPPAIRRAALALDEGGDARS